MRALKSLARVLLSQRVIAPGDRRFIFCYHDISDPGAPHHHHSYSTSIEAFRRQIEFLSRHFRFVPLDDIVAPGFGRHDLPSAALTFDDSFRSVKEAAFPFLRSQGIPFAVFVNRMALEEDHLDFRAEYAPIRPGGEGRVFMTKEDLAFLSDNGVTVGSHSSSHRMLVNCTTAVLEQEVGSNKAYLEKLLNTRIRHFAIPYGKREHYDTRTLDYCVSCGHDFVYSTNPACLETDTVVGGARTVPRIGLTGESNAELTFLINRPIFRKVDI